MLHKIIPEPVTAAEIATAAGKQAAADAMAAGDQAAEHGAGAKAGGDSTGADRRVAHAAGTGSKSSTHDQQ